MEEVSSVVLGDQGAFKADHSEAEPQLVFFKATSAKPAQTNALITTRGGHEISLSLVSQGKSDRSEPVDYVLNCERPRSFLIASTHPVFVVGETKNVATENQPTSTAPEKPGGDGPEEDFWPRRFRLARLADTSSRCASFGTARPSGGSRNFSAFTIRVVYVG